MPSMFCSRCLQSWTIDISNFTMPDSFTVITRKKERKQNSFPPDPHLPAMDDLAEREKRKNTPTKNEDENSLR